MNLKNLKSSLISQFSTQIIKAFLTVFVGSLTVRYLGPSAIGKFSYSLAIVGILAPFGALGIKSSLSSLLCETNHDSELVSTAFLLRIIGSFLIGIIILPIFLIETDFQLKILLLIIYFSNIFNTTEVFEIKLLDDNKGKIVALITFIQNIFFVISTLLIIYFKASLLAFGAIYSIQFLLRGVLNLYFARFNNFLKILSSFKIDKAIKIIQRGWPLILTGFSVILYTKSDQIMLSLFGESMTDIGKYAVALRIISAMYFIPVVISRTYLPFVGRNSSEFSENFYLKKLYRISWIAGITSTFTTFLLFSRLIPFVFGNEFVDSQKVLQILAPSLFAVTLGCANSAWLNTNNYQKQMLARTSIGLVANLIFNVLLIPKYGIYGAALGTTLGQYFSVFGILFMNKKIRSNMIKLSFPF
tara:strand:+ start:1993 stop:3237 length:1245 start_codon:yes stop_codon:yes gene_type:complete